MYLLVGFPNNWRTAFRKSVAGFSFSFLLKFITKNIHFSRSLAQLILVALSLYPLEVKEGPERRVLSDVPLCRFSLTMYPSVGFADSGPKWPLWGVLGLALASWSFWGSILTS